MEIFGCCFFGIILSYSVLYLMIVFEQLNSGATEVPLECLENDLDDEEQEEDLSFSQVMSSYQQMNDIQALDVVSRIPEC